MLAKAMQSEQRYYSIIGSLVSMQSCIGVWTVRNRLHDYTSHMCNNELLHALNFESISK